jgi:hypothetical protein
MSKCIKATELKNYFQTAESKEAGKVIRKYYERLQTLQSAYLTFAATRKAVSQYNAKVNLAPCFFTVAYITFTHYLITEISCFYDSDNYRNDENATLNTLINKIKTICVSHPNAKYEVFNDCDDQAYIFVDEYKCDFVKELNELAGRTEIIKQKLKDGGIKTLRNKAIVHIDFNKFIEDAAVSFNMKELGEIITETCSILDGMSLLACGEAFLYRSGQENDIEELLSAVKLQGGADE